MDIMIAQKNLLSYGRMNYFQLVDKANNKKIKRLELFMLKESRRLIVVVVVIALRHKSECTFEFQA